MRGYFAVGIFHPKTKVNVGTLWRTALSLGANFVFTVGNRYHRQSSECKSLGSLPLFEYLDLEEFKAGLPLDCLVVGVEIDEKALPIKSFVHPTRCVYLLGAEDYGLTAPAKQACHLLVQLPGEVCHNVAVAGAMVMYDRIVRGNVFNESTAAKLSERFLRRA